MDDCSITLYGSGRILVPTGLAYLFVCEQFCLLLFGFFTSGRQVVNTDRRVRRTQKLLHGALISLVLEKKYDSITIQEILDRADIGRSTFYAHFKGKGELLISGIQELRNTLDSAMQSESSRAKRH